MSTTDEQWKEICTRLPEITKILGMIPNMVRNAVEYKAQLKPGHVYCIPGRDIKTVENTAGPRTEFSLVQLKLSTIKKYTDYDPQSAYLIANYDPEQDILLVIHCMTDYIPIVYCKIPCEDDKFTMCIPSHGVYFSLKKSALDSVQNTRMLCTDYCFNPECRQHTDNKQANKMKRCSRCKQVAYCSRECQVVHWKAGHRKACAKYAQK